MATLQSLLEALSKGQASFERVNAALERYLADSPHRGPDVLRVLKEARTKGLPHHLYVALSGKVPAETSAPSDDTTVVGAGDKDADRTVINPAEPYDSDTAALAPRDAAARAGVVASNDEDATIVGRQGADEDTTQVGAKALPDGSAAESTVPPPGDRDVTAVNVAAGRDATTVNTTAVGDRRTAVLHGREGLDFAGVGDESLGAMGRGAETAPARSGPPTDMVHEMTTEKAGVGREFGAGDLLRGRFQLISKLGEGGMGAVWKGKDQLKVEARDRNPFVAIKLLQGDFKEHPEAFIALQRETAKQQRLAHPNIATVYDFDRDNETGTVFMTMEVMDGEGMDIFIRKIPEGGLPEAEAMPLIEDTCAGLAYAHEAKLVHSDLKPGNAFMVKDPDRPHGRVKLLDFGIARASKTKTDSEGEKTLFDPGELGALTPTYATIEMFDGMDPDPRDDIYALAIMAYQLLTGRHPFSKKPAPKAKALGLKVEPVAKLDKRQNRGLARGLAFHREDRTPTVEQFLNEVRRRKRYTKQIVLGSILGVLVVVGGLWKPVSDALWQREVEQHVNVIIDGDDPAVMTHLVAVRGTLDERTRDAVLANEDVAQKIIDVYRRRARAVFDVRAGRYDHAAAEKETKELTAIYPRDSTVLELKLALAKEKDDELARLNTAYNEHLEEGRLLPVDGDDITDVLGVVAKLDPEHSLLSDSTLPIKYGDLAQAAIDEGKYRQADAVLKVAIPYAPDDGTLGNLRYQVDKELARQRNQALVAEIQRRLQAQWDSFRSLADFQRVRDDLIKLAELDPKNAALVSLQAAIRKAFDAELTRRIAAKAWDEGEALLAEFAKLLSIPVLGEHRANLSRAEQAAGFARTLSAEQLEEHKSALSALLAEPETASEWETAVGLGYKDLMALLPAGDPALRPFQEQIAQHYVRQATGSRKANRFEEATAYVEKARLFYPELKSLDVERDAIATAEAAFRKAEAEKRRLAELERLKRTVKLDLKTGNARDAKANFEKLRAGLAPDDPFLAEGATLIGQAYQQLAEKQAEKKQWAAAEQLARGGLELAPDLEGLKTAWQRYATEARVAELTKVFSGAERLDVGAVRKGLAALKRTAGAEYAKYLDDFAKRLQTRIKAMEKTNVLGANALLGQAKQLIPGNRLLESIKLTLPSKIAARGLEEVEAGTLTLARGTLEEMQRKEPGHPDMAGLQKALQEKQAQAQQYYQGFLRFKKAYQAKQGQPYLQQAMSIWTDNPEYQKAWKGTYEKTKVVRGQCSIKLAGYGKQAKGVCYDMLGDKQKGPELVVVPAGGNIAKPFAIGRYEVTIGDYNAYCKLSGQCRGVTGGDDKLPVTGISIRDAQTYAKWLSKTTGQVYRLPSAAEWEYAAAATDTAAKIKSIQNRSNCRVIQENKILKGQSLSSVAAGAQNAWGLKNVIGNAQEWVASGAGVMARGGAHTDKLAECAISLSKPHTGNADQITGFRLVREVG